VTGGGGIGPYVYTPRFVDGGNIQLPNRAAYKPDGTSWGIENVGVIPTMRCTRDLHDAWRMNCFELRSGESGARTLG